MCEQVKESDVHPNNPVLPHPALAESLVVPVFIGAMADLATRSASPSAGHCYSVFKSYSDRAAPLRTFDSLRALLSEKPFAELGAISHPSGMVAAAVSDHKPGGSHQSSHTPQRNLPAAPAAAHAEVAPVKKLPRPPKAAQAKLPDAQPPAAPPRSR